jgi:hypothetical protein
MSKVADQNLTLIEQLKKDLADSLAREQAAKKELAEKERQEKTQGLTCKRATKGDVRVVSLNIPGRVPLKMKDEIWEYLIECNALEIVRDFLTEDTITDQQREAAKAWVAENNKAIKAKADAKKAGN